ncbi:hypothetical protein CDAR_399691 [Caerostris darwini]|uniref:Uncharacterized protein n=1 Tax=Caerostris darwini TaxID=1538125 RepID=A0AAV4P603_9ARAC|nr:hypothetical protein CDAR_399691 [Caerostris darwini]
MSVCAPFHSAGACRARGVALQTSRVELAESAKTHGGVTWRNPFPKKKGRAVFERMEVYGDVCSVLRREFWGGLQLYCAKWEGNHNGEVNAFEEVFWEMVRLFK